MNPLKVLFTKQEKEDAEKERVRDEAILASIGDGMVTIDKEGKIVIFNRAAEELTNWKAAEVVGKSWFETVPAMDDEGKLVSREDRDADKALTTGQKIYSQTIYLQKGTGKIPVAITATPIILNDQIIGAVGVFRDITHEREVDRMKTEFISLASHQLRTPLSAMKWFSEMLLAGDAGQLNAEQTEFMNNIYQSNERMIDLVNSLLNISRIESGRIIIDPKPTNLGILVKEVITELQKKIAEKKLNLVMSIHDGLPEINVDPKLIREVYTNLLTNAVKYTPAGGEIEIFISQKGEEIISQISDNGYGIPEKQQAKVFQKFFRAENVVKVETDGTGLGLYLIKAIVESSGGKIWFQSVENKGTSFFFSLQRAGSPAKQGEVTINS